MPWTTPTLGELRRLNRDHIAAFLAGADATIPNSVLRVLSDANAGLAALNLQYLEWLARQLMPDTAEGEWLDRFGQIWLGGRKAATFAAGTVRLTGAAGTIVPTASRLASNGGVEFETLSEVTLGDSGAVASVRAITPGLAGNVLAGAPLTLQVAISGVDANATVITMAGGIDAENDDDLRARVLLRIRQPPMGGNADDYVAWALEVPGVTRAWVSPNEMGFGTVTVRFTMDDLRASSNHLVDGFPIEEDLDAMRAHLALRRPVSVKDLFVVAPLPQPINFELQNLTADDDGTLLNIERSVKAMLRDYARPAHAVNGVAAPAQTIHAAWVNRAVLDAAGVESFELDMDDEVMPSPGHMGVVGSITLG